MTITATFSDDAFEGNYMDAVKIRINENDKISEKIVSLDAFLNCINKNAKKTKEMKRIGAIPDSFYDGYLNDESYFETKSVFILPKHKRIFYLEHNPYVIPMPSLVFLFHVQLNTCVEVSAFVLADKVAKEDSVLYYYPFSNVAKNGRICWGDYQLPDVHNFMELPPIMNIFLDGINNYDLFQKENNRKALDLAEMLNQLNGKNSFPISWLVKKQIKLGELLK